MIKELKKGQTLLVKGPSRIELIEGKVEVFGKLIEPVKGSSGSPIPLIDDNSTIIPISNMYPFHAIQKSKLEIYTNNQENITLIEENSIPDKWIEIRDSIIADIKARKNKNPLKITVLGISSGKTTLIKYLANSFIKSGFKGGYLDSDLGQQIIYLPTTLNIGEIKKPIISSEDIEPEDTIFIGATFPKGDFKYILSQSCETLIDNYLKNHEDSDFILIDTDGWVKQGETSITYKNFFIETVDPDILIVFHDEEIEELKTIEEKAQERKDRKLYLIEEKNTYFFEKDKEERRFLRQSQFAKVLEKFRKISITLGDIKFIKHVYDEETGKKIEEPVNIHELNRLPYHYVIVALLTEDSELIKVGLLFFINYEKDYVLIFSDLNFKEEIKVKKILLGSLRLSVKGNFQGYLYL